MEIRKNLNGATLELALEGRLDTSTSPALEQELRSSLSGITGLVFDLKDLDYLSSAGLRVLLFAQKRMNDRNGSMIVRNPNETVMDVFDVTGFLNILTVENSEPSEE